MNVKLDKIQSKGVKSVRSRVTNIFPICQNLLPLTSLRKPLALPDSWGQAEEYVLTEKDWAIIRELSEKRYAKWEWNYGASPEAEIEKEERFAGGKLELKFNIRDGLIQDMHIFGDFFGKKEVSEFAEMLNGKEYREGAVAELLDSVDFEGYFINITRENFLSCLFA